MEKKESEGHCSLDSSMTLINSWQDVSCFAGTLVAFKAKTYYLTAGQNPINSDPDIHYGYIGSESKYWRNNKKGYELTRVLTKNAIAGECALVNQKIKKNYLLIRYATSEEKKQIHKAIELDNAKFEYISDKEEAYAMVRGTLEAFWQEKRAERSFQS